MACEHKAPGLICFADGAQMDALLAVLIASALARALAQRGAASLGLSGGSTPRGLYAHLSRQKLDWSKVHVSLVDERMVAPDDAASNEKLVRETLLHNAAAGAQFLGLYKAGSNAGDAARACDEALQALPLPFDAFIVGMGVDGHTASWFPGAQGLAAALDPHGETLCVPILAPTDSVAGKHRQRLTLTRSALAGTRLGVLVLGGQAKRAAYEKACAPGPVAAMPVRAILRAPPRAFWPCWAP